MRVSHQLSAVALLVASIVLLTPAVTAAQVQQISPQQLIDINPGDDGWFTTFDGGTWLDYAFSPLPAGFFGPGSLQFTQTVSLFGVPIVNSQGIAWHTDTVVRRRDSTGYLAVGSCADISIEFIALRVESPPFTVSFSDGHTEQWKLTGGLSTAARQPLGAMTICRTTSDGGTFDASLPALFVLYYERVSPLPTTQIITDCGLSQCPQALFQAQGESWTLRSQLLQPGIIDPLPGNVELDVDADGILDGVFTIGRSNFQGGIKPPSLSGGGGGGGGDECDQVEHVGGGGQDHTKSSHKNYVSATGDTDGSGKPDHCDDDEEEEEPVETDGEVTPQTID